MGTHGYGYINNNWERLIELYEETNRLAIGGTLFKRRDIHNLSWRSPDFNTVTHIDIIINQKWRCSLRDVKVRHGADVGSDHMLVMATLSQKLRKAKRGKTAEVRCRKVGEP